MNLDLGVYILDAGLEYVTNVIFVNFHKVLEYFKNRVFKYLLYANTDVNELSLN